jgi:hypothetical protein
VGEFLLPIKQKGRRNNSVVRTWLPEGFHRSVSAIDFPNRCNRKVAYCVDNETGKQESLGTKDEVES